MRVLIIEDEKPAADRLEMLIKQYDPAIEIAGWADSVKSSVKWIESNPQPDLAFLDIQLADGLSFEIFEQTALDCPVIFTTAFDEYAIRAFKVNSIDYLLKPIDLDELKGAMEKYRKIQPQYGAVPRQHIFDKVLNLLTDNYKRRFVIKVGEHIRSIPVEDILYFYSLEKATYLHTVDDRNYVIDYSLEQVDNLIDPKMFFRINRSYIIALNSFTDIISYTNSRLKIELLHSDDNDVIVAREKTSDFKKWLDR